MHATPAAAHVTLAEELSEPVLADEPLTVVLDGADAAAAVAAMVPEGSRIFAAHGNELRWWDGASQSPTVSPWPGTPEGLMALVREGNGDVLFVSDSRLLTPKLLKSLLQAVAIDTACATVSVGESARPIPAGLPPPGVVAPTRGVALVRRDHLLLALAEAGFVGRPDVRLVDPASDRGIIATTLASLERPGFVHRGVSRAAVPPPEPPSRSPVVVARTATEIVLDGRCLDEPLSGTQVQVLGLAVGLLGAGADVALLRPTELHPTVAAEVARTGVELPMVQRADLGRPDVFHRPFQIRSLHELADCLSIGTRLVLTHQDMILDRTPGYARTIKAWEDYRRATEAALSSADQVGFFSKHAAIDAASEGSLELDRATVVYLGVDHVAGRVAHENSLIPLDGRPYLLTVGNTFWHKNRLFALRLVQWLIEESGWDGGLVLAGAAPWRGSSVAAEEILVRETASLHGRVSDLGRVSDADQAALYRGARLVLFPSLYEGFGLIPFEAAHFGTASVYAHRASMQELLPSSGALPSFDLDAAGPFVLSLLESDARRQRVVAEIRAIARELTWERTAAGYIDVYTRALARRPRPMSRLLLGVTPVGSTPGLTEREAFLIAVYRRRPVFRAAADGVLRVGSLVLRAARRVLAR